ncbi:MAG: hypothetical protein ACO294_07600 [Methylococcales bacterium]|jgi:hypothetical protein
MKKLMLICLVVSLSGCAVVEKARQVWPRAHDPALVSGYVDLEVELNNVNCKEKETINPARNKADWLNKYAEFRNDPQQVSTKAIVENLDKATKASEAVCDRWINLSKTRMSIIKEAWSGR